MHPVKTIVQGTYRANIFQDEMSESPREWDNLGTMACFHRRYTLGDHPKDPNLPDEVRLKIVQKLVKRKDVISLPLYLYDHSGLRMNTTGFHCPWDSGQVGWIFVSKERIRKEYGKQRISKKLLKRVYKVLEYEVENYNQWLCGDVYGYEIEQNGELVSSCWGFYGLEYIEKEVKELIEDFEKLDNLHKEKRA